MVKSRERNASDIVANLFSTSRDQKFVPMTSLSTEKAALVSREDDAERKTLAHDK